MPEWYLQLGDWGKPLDGAIAHNQKQYSSEESECSLPGVKTGLLLPITKSCCYIVKTYMHF